MPARGGDGDGDRATIDSRPAVYGQLGDGTNVDRSTPTPVSGVTDVVELTTGFLHTCARQGGGAVVCWGNNMYGQLGDGTDRSHNTPTPVYGSIDAVEISAGDTRTCARDRRGGGLCWGDTVSWWGSRPTPVVGL